MNDRQPCMRLLSGENVTIVDLEGEIDIYSATEFKELLLASIDGGARRIVIDATKVSFIDSSGLSVLVTGVRRLGPLGGSLAVACDEKIGHILEITALDKAMVVRPSLDGALRAVRPPGWPSPETSPEDSEPD
jgi:anti-sigma B factor antagonist